MVTLVLGSFALISLPWFHYLEIQKSIILLVLFWIIIFLISKIRLYGKTIGIGILTFSTIIFLVSVLMIPPEVRQEVELQRRTVDQSGLKVPKQIFVNKLIESYRYREGLLFEHLDFGNYFFIGHPRERVGVKEILKIYLAYLPLIVLGLITSEHKVRWFLLSIAGFAVTLSVFMADRSVEAGFALIIPAVYFAARGAENLLNGGVRKKLFLGIIFLLFIFEWGIFNVSKI